MIDFNKNFSAKVLLFGEYTVLLGGDALAMPFDTLSAHWDKSEMIDHSLLLFLKYISQQSSLSTFIDASALENLTNEIKKGLILKTNIPIGYGLGSSASVCSAVWDCINNRDLKLSINELKSIFSTLESYFHGTSSGVDPLVSYYSKAIKITTEGSSLLDQVSLDIPVYLYDSLLPRSGKQYIHWFTDHIKKDKPFKSAMEQLTELNNELIQGTTNDFKSSIQTISELQWQYMAPMIPEELRDFWKDSLRDDESFCKLCGAGGGGMFLYFSSRELSNPLASKYPLYSL